MHHFSLWQLQRQIQIDKLKLAAKWLIKSITSVFKPTPIHSQFQDLTAWQARNSMVMVTNTGVVPKRWVSFSSPATMDMFFYFFVSRIPYLYGL